MSKSISILGCGWLGLPLARHLLSQGWLVKGSTTSLDKLDVMRHDGIDPFLIDLVQGDPLPQAFFQTDYLLINVPPTRLMRQVEAYHPFVDAIEESGVSKVIFISSTSVYPSENNTVSERDTDAIADGSNSLLDIERLFQRASFQTAIVRFGGLVGGTRYPGRFFNSDRPVTGARQPINLIHLVDCIRVIEKVVEKDSFPLVINGVAGTHPTKQEFYSLAAQLAGNDLPEFIEDDSPYKIVNNQALSALLGIQLKYPDLLEMLRDNSLWDRR